MSFLVFAGVAVRCTHEPAHHRGATTRAGDQPSGGWSAPDEGARASRALFSELGVVGEFSALVVLRWFMPAQGGGRRAGKSFLKTPPGKRKKRW